MLLLRLDGSWLWWLLKSLIARVPPMGFFTFYCTLGILYNKPLVYVDTHWLNWSRSSREVFENKLNHRSQAAYLESLQAMRWKTTKWIFLGFKQILSIAFTTKTDQLVKQQQVSKLLSAPNNSLFNPFFNPRATVCNRMLKPNKHQTAATTQVKSWMSFKAHTGINSHHLVVRITISKWH